MVCEYLLLLPWNELTVASKLDIAHDFLFLNIVILILSCQYLSLYIRPYPDTGTAQRCPPDKSVVITEIKLQKLICWSEGVFIFILESECNCCLCAVCLV